MFYFALILILLGLGSLFFAFGSVLSKPARNGDPSGPSTSHPPKNSKEAEEQSKPSVQPPPRKAPPLETVLHRTSPESREQDRTLNLEDSSNKKTEEVARSVRVLEKKRTVPRKDEVLFSRGILFFDHNRQLPLQMEKMDQTPLAFFSSLKRSGEATLSIENGNFILHGPNASYRYHSGDLDQILFLKGGVGLVPLNRSYPIPVFLTEEFEKIKDFIKQNSRVHA